SRADRAAVEEVAERAAELAPVAVPETRQWRRSQPAAAPTALPPIRVGAQVGVPRLNARGTIRGLSDGGRDAEVEVGGLRVRVKTADLTPPDAVDGPSPEPSASVVYAPARDAGSALPVPSEDVPIQLDLRGKRAAEAVEAVDRYLDDAYLAGLHSVRIVHGHGTGTVRQAVRELLAHHPHVQSWAPADRRQGGDGATDVQLAV